MNLSRYEFDKDENDDNEKINKLVFDKTKSYINELKTDMFKDLFRALSEDIENYMYERFDNVKHKYFDQVTNFLLGKYFCDNDDPQCKEWLTSIGYDASSFRKKIYEENKEDILNSLQSDATYEKLENKFNSYFNSWTFQDISKAYPQTIIIQKFMNYLVEKEPEGFKVYIQKLNDRTIQQQLEKIEYYKKEIADLQSKHYNIKSEDLC